MNSPALVIIMDGSTGEILQVERLPEDCNRKSSGDLQDRAYDLAHKTWPRGERTINVTRAAVAGWRILIAVGGLAPIQRTGDLFGGKGGTDA
jgi:hypothetical protein